MSQAGVFLLLPAEANTNLHSRPLRAIKFEFKSKNTEGGKPPRESELMEKQASSLDPKNFGYIFSFTKVYSSIIKC